MLYSSPLPYVYSLILSYSWSLVSGSLSFYFFKDALKLSTQDFTCSFDKGLPGVTWYKDKHAFSGFLITSNWSDLNCSTRRPPGGGEMLSLDLTSLLHLYNLSFHVFVPIPWESLRTCMEMTLPHTLSEFRKYKKNTLLSMQKITLLWSKTVQTEHSPSVWQRTRCHGYPGEIYK